MNKLLGLFAVAVLFAILIATFIKPIGWKKACETEGEKVFLSSEDRIQIGDELLILENGSFAKPEKEYIFQFSPQGYSYVVVGKYTIVSCYRPNSKKYFKIWETKKLEKIFLLPPSVPNYKLTPKAVFP